MLNAAQRASLNDGSTLGGGAAINAPSSAAQPCTCRRHEHIYASPSQLLFSSLAYSCELQSSTYDDLFIRSCSWEEAFQTDTTCHKHQLHHGIYNLTNEKKVTRAAKLGHTVARKPLWLRQRELSGAVLRSQSLYVSTPLTKLLVSRHDWRMPLVSSKAN
jgi:hypothetical protein